MFVKYTVGIDVAKDELVCCMIGLTDSFTIQVLGRKKFSNNDEGFAALYKWALKLTKNSIVPEFVMEATGVYHVSLANHIYDQQAVVGVILPNKISNYMRTLVLKTINDDTSSECIAEYGARHKIAPWVKPDADLLQMRTLTRERENCVKQRAAAKNQKHAAIIAQGEGSSTVMRLEALIALFDAQEKEIEAEIAKLVKANKTLSRKIKHLTSIPGVGLVTAWTVVGETLGFSMITSSRQLVSYAGLDVRTKESGTSVKSKTRISKKGNKHIRKALYFPAFTAVNYNENMSELYERLVSKQGIRMKAAVAVQRKLLVLMYTLWKTDQPFDPAYELNRRKEKSEAHR